MANKNKLMELLFLQELPSGESRLIELSEIIPDTLSYDYAPSFQSNNLLGRISPIQLYSGGSKQSYTFNLVVHEDMVSSNTNFTSLIELIDAIKSLSYPAQKSTGELVLPQVYFQLGEIAGYGLVSTSVSWQKPFRNGHYILAEISFSITIEKILPKVEVAITSEELTDDSTYDFITYSSQVRIQPNSFLTGYVPSIITGLSTDAFGGYETSLSDFITTELSTQEKQTNIAFTAQYFDMAVDRLKNLYGIFASIDQTSTKLVELNTSINAIDLITFNSTNLTVSFLNKDVQKLISRLRSQLEGYVEYYYTNIDKNMTQAQKDALNEEIDTLLDNMSDMYGVVSGYGASN